MPTDAQKKAKAKYNSKSYDRIAFDFSIGMKEKIKNHADRLGISMNKYVVGLVEADLKKHDETKQG